MEEEWPRLAVLLLVTSSAITVAWSSPILFNVSEELPSGTLVGNVKISSNISQQVPEEDRGRLQFHILSGDGLRITSIFSINSRTGAIFTNAMIDREQLCDLDLVCQLEFDVTVKLDANFLKLLAVRVIVDDVNDNAPAFPKGDITLTVPESAPVSSEIPISGALDRDAGINSSISYSLEVSSVFGLREVRQLDGSSALRLVVERALDREAVPLYSFLILAADGPGPQALTGTLTVSVLVSDVNDNVPQFSKDSFDLTVMETAPVGTVFGHLTASDGDVGANGQLSYRFSLLTNSEVTNLFSLNATSGELSVAGVLQYESGSSFQCVVEVTDRGVPPQLSQAILRIRVEDAGNTPPKLDLLLAEPVFGDQSAMLSEDVQVGTFVGTLKAEDLDEGAEGEVNCSSEDPHFSLQDLLDTDRYGIVVSLPLDREKQQEMSVVLRCSDGGDPQLTSSTSFKVLVRDVNDNAPEFSQLVYRPWLTENGRGEQYVARVLATDSDDSSNSVVTYALDPQSALLFSVDAATGTITTRGTFDREATPSRTLTVYATDSGSPALTGTATVSVRIADVNDNPPYLNRSDVYVSENLPVGGEVPLSVADPDEGENGTVVVTLLPVDFPEPLPFAVLPDGSLRVSSALDRESRSAYVIPLVLVDRGSPPLSATATLTVQLVDNNDHAPVFLFPTALNDSVTVVAESPVGSPVCRIQAEDGDLGLNGMVTYSIADGNSGQWLAMNNLTGDIFTIRALTPLAASTLRLQVTASDLGHPPLLARAFLDVYLRSNRSGPLGPRGSGDGASGNRYVVIAGVLAGITFVVAVVVVAVIVHMRTTDARRRAAATRRNKARREEEGVAEEGNVHKLSVLCPQNGGGMVLGEVSKPGGDGGGDTTPVGVPRFPLTVQLDDGRGFGSGLPLSSCAAVRGAVKDSGEGVVLDLQGHPSFVDFSEGRNRLMSEDHNSDTSGETTTCDSGRGASDEEIVYPVPRKTPGSSDPPPRIPPRRPFSTTITTTPTPQWSRDAHVLSTNWSGITPISSSTTTTTAADPAHCYVTGEEAGRLGALEEGEETDDSSFLGYYRSSASRKGHSRRVRFSFDKGDPRAPPPQNSAAAAASLHGGANAALENEAYSAPPAASGYPPPNVTAAQQTSSGHLVGLGDFHQHVQRPHGPGETRTFSPSPSRPHADRNGERPYGHGERDLRLNPESKYPRSRGLVGAVAANNRFPRKSGHHCVAPSSSSAAAGWEARGPQPGGAGRTAAARNSESLSSLGMEDDVSTTTSGSYSIESEVDAMNASLEC